MKIQFLEIDETFEKFDRLVITNLNLNEWNFLMDLEKFNKWLFDENRENKVKFNSWCSNCGNHHNEYLFCDCGNKMVYSGH